MGVGETGILLRPSAGMRRLVITPAVVADAVLLALLVVTAASQGAAVAAVLAVFYVLCIALLTFLLPRLANSRVEIGEGRVLVHSFLPLKPFDVPRAEIVTVDGVSRGFGDRLPRLGLRDARSIPVYALAASTEVRLEQEVQRLESVL
jgi:hypothetical protein